MINLLQDRDPRKFSTEPKAQESTVEVQVQRTEGTDGWKFQAEGRRSVRINQSSSQSKLLSLSTFFCSDPRQIGRCPPKLDRAICLTQSTNSNVNLIWNIFTDTPRSNVKANTHTCITQSIWHIKSTSWEQGFTTVLIIFSLLYLLLTASQPHL